MLRESDNWKRCEVTLPIHDVWCHMYFAKLIFLFWASVGLLQVDFHWKMPWGTSERRINQSTEERQTPKIQVKDSCKCSATVIAMQHRFLVKKPKPSNLRDGSFLIPPFRLWSLHSLCVILQTCRLSSVAQIAPETISVEPQGASERSQTY